MTEKHQPKIIGVCGASASGKTTFCRNLTTMLEAEGLKVATISADRYYKTKPKECKAEDYDFDDPAALEWSLLAYHLSQLLEGHDVEIPVYSFLTHSREVDTHTVVHKSDVILVEGILVFAPVELQHSFSMKIFITEDQDVCLARRINRDVVERGRTATSVVNQYLKFVKPSFQKHVKPYIKKADLIIPNAAYNRVALTCVAHHLMKAVEGQEFIDIPKGSISY